ncbi:MAG TPA: hypothetical protein VMT19_01790 [Thermoanaerobaculaceae bacterium]|nr:hypothetical protein [Thermoanaerobaculaceae bacterium]
MARPDYLICLECESEVEDFIWRDGEIRRASCEVCGNSDTDAFSLPEDYGQDLDEDQDEAAEDEEGDEDEEEYPDDYEDYDDEDEEE